jgi:hypothetical protein
MRNMVEAIVVKCNDGVYGTGVVVEFGREQAIVLECRSWNGCSRGLPFIRSANQGDSDG